MFSNLLVEYILSGSSDSLSRMAYRGISIPSFSSMAYTDLRSWMSNCISRLLMMYGLRSLVYSIAFSMGKPVEWNATRQSQSGQSSTGSCVR